MISPNLLPLALLLLSLYSIQQTEASQKYNYIADEEEIHSIPGEFYPFCVEVANVWPPPGSILQSIHLHSKVVDPGRKNYLLRVAFSRPVSITNHDTSAGWQPEIADMPIEGGWLGPYEDSVVKALEKYNLDKVPPVFLTPSQSSVERYYPFRIVSWQGSSKEFLLYFTLPSDRRGPNILLSKKVYLVIDGGRFFSFGKVGSASHPIFVQTTIIGEYYFDEYVRRNTWFKPKPPVLFRPSPYCEQRKSRPQFINQQDIEETSETNFTAWLNDGAHTIEAVPGSSIAQQQQQLSLNLSLTVKGAGGTFSFKLPSMIKALYGNVNVSVRIPDHATLKIQQPSTAPKVFVPIKRVPIYELRERIYHNGLKMMMPVTPPAFATASFTNNEKDIAEGLFPKRIMVVATIGNDVNMEVVDIGTGVKLGRYYPFWEDIKSAHLVEGRLPKMAWFEISRDAPIAAKSNLTRYRKILFGVKQKLETKYKFLSDNIQCPIDSRRNPSGRRGATLEHLIEYGPLYHLLEPLHPSSWSVKNKGIQIAVTNDKGTKLSASLLGSYPGVDINIPSGIVEGLQQYRCLLPPIKDIPKPEKSHTVIEKWVHLDGCVFVPTTEAESEQCGGLRLFKNLTAIVDDSNFCDKPFGDCIGLPFSSLHRFPVIPTFGLPELSGWIPCSSDQCPIHNTNQQHPVGRHFVDGQYKAMSKSILKFSKTKETPSSAEEDAVMEFSPTLSAESKSEYALVLSGVEILDPKLSAQPLVEGVYGSPEAPPLSSADCDTVWHLQAEPLSLNTSHPREATLTATVHNHGQGGGDYIFEVECTESIIVHADNSIISEWIEPMSSVNVTFFLSGDLATSSPNKKHKCELTIKSLREDDAALKCTKWLTTFYGAFKDPCHLKAPTPSVDLAYYVLAASQYESPQLQLFLDSLSAEMLELVKVITISLLVPPEQEHLMSILHRITVSCISESITVLLENQLIQESMRFSTNITGEQKKHPVAIHGVFTAPRKVYFFATRSWMESQSTPNPLTSSCVLVLRALSPNPVCRATRNVLERIHIPLVKADIEAIHSNGPFSLLYLLYGRQSDLVMMSLCLCLIVGLVSALLVAAGCIVLCINRSKLPRKGTLGRLQGDLDKAMEADKKYWEDPLMYLCSMAATDEHSNCVHYGEVHHGPHFILHQWRATESLDTQDIKHLKIAGTLKFKTQELPVMFGHVKKVYIHQAKDNANIWVQASSGMYLLPVSTVSQDYTPSLVEFCKKQKLDKCCYKSELELLEKKDVQEWCEQKKPIKGEVQFAVGEEVGLKVDDAFLEHEMVEQFRAGRQAFEQLDIDSEDEHTPLLNDSL